jgi:uncharacterized protein (DUF305 family)
MVANEALARFEEVRDMTKKNGAEQHSEHAAHEGKNNPYAATLLSLGVSFAVMYAVMYSMADRWSHVYLNLSNVYMAGLMAGSMLPVMLVTMPRMFKDKKANAAMWAGSAVGLALFWWLLRTEAGVGDRQFMRAMIPHHSAAIQMCRESSLTDPRVRTLCEGIVASQEQEIAEMKALLAE